MRLCNWSAEVRSSSRVDGNVPEQRDGVVIELAPQHRIERPEQTDRVVVPAPPHVAGQRLEPVVRGHHELSDGAGLRNDRRELGAGGRQHPDGVRAEDARFLGLDDQHALKQPPIDKGHAQEGVVRVFSRLAEILEPRMLGRILHDLGPQLFADEPGQPFRQSHPDASDAVGTQSDGGRQHQRGAVRLEQVHRADVRLERALDQLDDVVERLGWMAAVGNKMADFFERPEQEFRVVWSRVGAKQETCFAKSPAIFDRGPAIGTTLWAFSGWSYINVHYVPTGGLLPYHAH